MDRSYETIEALSFDCYGTLIDWEQGILAAFGALLGPHGVELPDAVLLEAFAREEARLEAGPYRRYREVLSEVAGAICHAHGVTATPDELEAFGGSVADWPAFPDSAEALARLAQRFRLAVVTNCDDDLFAASARRLGDPFSVVVTAQQTHTYKPDVRHFEVLFERLGLPRQGILHVAQSLYHDHVPAAALGLRSAWVDRRHGRSGHGATPPAEASPELTVPDMASLADRLLGPR